MPKKSQDNEYQERRRRQDKFLQWRWEFLRDNDEYKKIYSEAIEKRKHESFFPSEWEKNQVLRFGLLGECLIDPEKSIEDIKKTINKIYRGLSPKTNNIDEAISKHPKCEELRFYPKYFYSHYAEVDYRRYGYFKLEVDLSKVNYAGSLKKELHALVDMICDDLLAMSKEEKKLFAKKERRLSTDFDHLLEIGRLYNSLQKKQTKRVSFTQAAKEFFPRFRTDPEKHQKDYRKDFERDYKEYLRLVQGGYKELTYP
ncbi:MAG: hypothetical protein GX654_14220 [Desulfatiglans sp.]|nr:hypothetical protein [Desulfatiglans sp.]